jgi:nicotinamidase/pyrazinamidase
MKALIVTDIQNDFFPNGSLPTCNNEKIIFAINDILPKFDLIIFTKDLHCHTMYGFASYQLEHYGKRAFDKYVNEQGEEDIIWPDHCVENTFGAEFHPDLCLERCKKDFYIFKKGNMPHYHPYTAFGEQNEIGDSELEEFLDERKVTEIFICGINGDSCVKNTAIDAANYGYTTTVIEDATSFLDDESKITTTNQLIDKKIKIIKSNKI